MSATNHIDINLNQIESLGDFEIELVSGSGEHEQAQMLVMAGGALSVIGAAARTAALVPTPFSPALAAFGTVAGLIGAGAAFAGGAALAGGGGARPQHAHYKKH